MPTVTSFLRRLLACTAPLALAACTVGPNYVRPAPLPAAQATPPEFKESLGWRPATPVAELDKGAWWSVFNDPLLDQLERKVAVTNQSVASAEANYRQAVAVVEEARAGFLPTVGLSSSLTHSGGGSASNGAVVTTGGTTVVTGSGAGTIGGTTGTTGTGTTGTTGTTGSTTSGTGSTGGTSFVTSGGSQTRYSIGADASWVLDVWGRIRRTVESDRATAQASAADLANATLSAQATLAADYFNVRAADDQIRILNENVVTYRRSLQITQNQYAAGTVARADVIAAQSQVLTAQASLIDFGRQRTANEHAVAILAGEAPAALTIPVGALPRVSPTPPAGLTTALLERRPDIAGAERAMQAANAQIGVAVAAYYPEISLSGSATSSSTSIGNLFKASNAVWSFGPQLSYTLLDFGARRAEVRNARAVYDRTVSDYRQTVLTAFGQVEDQLAAIRILEQEQDVRVEAEAAARRAEEIAQNQYRSGIIPFTTVITYQTQSLAAQQNTLNVLALRLQASVLLIQALGGGWTDTDLPRMRDIK